MLEHADGSEMCASGMPVILKSLGVASTSGNVAELFCRHKFGGAAVEQGFRARTRSGPRHRLDERQRGPARSPAGGQPLVATKVEAAQGGPG